MEGIKDFEFLPLRNRSCFVYGCFSTAASNKSNLGFHKFPKRGKRNIVVVKKNGDKCIYDRRQVWIDNLNIGREAASAIDGINVYVCSLHFARNDFYYNQDITGRRYLKELAIPRRNLPARKSSPLTTKFNLRSLNRRKYRGCFGFHNPDGRKLTAPRRFLGSRTLKNASSSQSYSRTVWVVKKPRAEAVQNDANANSQSDLTLPTVTQTFSLADKQKILDEGVTEEDDHCTIISESRPEPQEGANPWFTSELIIKDEPFSDFDQDSSDVQVQKFATDQLKQVNQEGVDEREDEEEEEDNYEPRRLVIETEDDEELGPTAGEDAMEEDQNYTVVEEQEAEVAHNDGETSDIYGEEEYLLDEDNDAAAVDKEDEQYEEYNYFGYNPDQEDHFVCLVCGEMFPSQHALAMHSVVHQDMTEEEQELFEEQTRNLTCEFCGRVLSTKATLREHIMIHTGEKPNQCMLCGKSFRHKANLVVHVNSHAAVSTYKCKKCNKAFTKKADFEQHLDVHVDNSGNLLVCKICNAVFKTQRTLYNHNQLHMKNGKRKKKSRDQNMRDPLFVCRTCGKVLSTKATLKEHEMIHSGEKPHTCNICGRTIRHKANFVVHVQTHGQGKSYECDMCDEAFMRKVDLTQHKQAVHSKSKLLRCPICNEVFKSPHKFNRHMEIHESVTYMNETEELMYTEDDEEITGFQPHLLEGFLDS